MAAKRIETQLTIRAIDKYSGKLKAMKTLTGRFADGVRTQMSALQKMRGPLKLIEDFREKQKVVAKSGQALEKAREKQKQLLLQIKATRNPTAQMRREFDRAHAAATRLQKTHARKRQELNALRSDLRQAGVATSKLASEERRLAADADRATTALGRQVEKMKRLETQQTRLTKAREKMDRSLARATNLSFVGNASMNVGRRILSFMSGPVEKAIDFESAMSDVRKVVDFDSPEGFKEMSNDIRELSTRIPKTASELAQITAAGGQSGLANEELLQFTEMAAKIGVAFDISAQQSGTAMANIKTALGLTLDETGLLFDAMNHLSNEMATTAPKVLEFTKRVAVDGKVKGFNATETLAFGAAMTAAGAQSDVVATSFRNMGKALVRGTAATGKKKSAFAALGLSAVDVAKRMSKDATGTVLDVFERINKIPKEAQSTTISQLFGDEARALAPIIDNLDLLREALGRVSEEEKYQGSAEKEYAVRAATTRNKIQLLRNEMDELGRSIGDVLMPPLNALLDTARPIIKSITEWTKAHPKLTKYLAVTAVAVGGLAAAGGALLTTAAALIGTLAVLRFGMTFLGTRAGATGAGLSAVGSGLGTIVTPLGRFNRRRARGVRRVGGALGTIAAITGLALVADELDMLNTALFALSMISFANLGKLPKLLKSIGIAGAAGAAGAAGVSTAAGAGIGAMLKRWGKGAVKGVVPRAFSLTGIGTLLAALFDADPTQTDEQVAAAADISEEEHNRNRMSHSMEGGGAWDTGLPLDAVTEARAQRFRTLLEAGPLPTSEQLNRIEARTEARREKIPALELEAGDIRSDIARVEADIARINRDMPNADMLIGQLTRVKNSLEVELEGVEAEIQNVETELEKATERSEELGKALKEIGGLEAAPEINMESIEAAMEKLREFRAAYRRALGPVPIVDGRVSDNYVPTPRPKPRATGGPVRTGMPYLVNENTPRSEWFVPSRSGGILNVPQAQSAFRSYLAANIQRIHNPHVAGLMRGARGLHAASIAGVMSTMMATPLAAEPASVAPPAQKAETKVEFHGDINIHVPAGVTDPQAIADYVVDTLSRRVDASWIASHYD